MRQRTGKPAPGERGQVRSNWHHILMWLGQPNAEKIPLETLRRMCDDPMVKAALTVRELAVLGKPAAFNYKPRDEEDAEETELGNRMVGFLNHVWNNIQPTAVVLLRNILTARRYGFAVLEKVWASTVDANGAPTLRTMPPESEWAGFLWIEKIKLLPAETVGKNGLATDEYGNLIAVLQSLVHYARPSSMQTLGGSVPVVERSPWGPIVFRGEDLDRIILYTANQEDAGNPYGISDLRAAYNSWYSKQANHASRNILLERLSGVIIGKYQTKTEQDQLEDSLDNIGPGAVLTVPKDSQVEILRGWEQAVEGYHRAIEYDDRQILQALLVPPLVIGGQAQETGSFARAASNFDSFMLVARQLQLELEEVVEEGFVKPLINANFPGVTHYPTFDFPELAEKDRVALSKVWSTAITDGYVDPAIDAHWLRQEMGVPGDAPEGHQFTRPAPAPNPFQTPHPDHHDEDAEAHASLVDDAPRGARHVMRAFTRALDDAFHTIRRQLEDELPDAIAEDQDLDARAAAGDDPTTVALRFTAPAGDLEAAYLAGLTQGAAAGRIATLRDLGQVRVKQLLSESEVQAFRSLAQNLSTAKAQEITSAVRSAVAEGLTLGEGAATIRERILGAFDQFDRVAAERIARTETMGAYNRAGVHAMQDAGLREWRFRATSTACPVCAPLDGRKFPLNDPDAPLPPNRTHPNCVCVAQPVVEVRPREA